MIKIQIMLTSVLVFTFVISSLILFIHSCMKWWKRSYVYSRLPGPKNHHIILGDLPSMVGKFGTNETNYHIIFFQWLTSLAQEYRKEGMFRIWLGNNPNVVLFSAETMEHVFNSQTLITKSRDYGLLHCWLGSGLLISTGKKWKERRKLLTPTFHYRILDDFVPIFYKHSETFVKNMAEFANKGPVNIVPHVSLLTLDIICETAMGINIEAQKARAAEYVKAISEFSDIFSRRLLKPWLYSDIIFSCTSDGAKMKEILKVLHEFSSKIIKQRKQELLTKLESEGMKAIFETKEDDLGRKKKKAFLDLLLQTQLLDNSITDEGISEEVDTFMFGGHDTTSAGISWALYNLGRHPEIQQNVYEEIQRILGNDKDREITLQDIREMKYLECVLKESLRLTPSVPSISRVASEEINIKGYTIPRNTTLTLLTHSLHRDPAVFPNPEQFDPDRFLPENCIGRHHFAYVPFSAGPRNCIGQKFAMMEMKITICNALRNFVFESVDPPESIQTSALLIFKAENGLRFRITKRE